MDETRISRLAMIATLAFANVLADCSAVNTHAQARATAQLSISYIDSWGVKGDGPGQLDQPTAIATDELGNAYLPDAGNLFIDKFNWQGRPLFSYGEQMLKDPQSITLDSGDAIYVTDIGRSSVLVFLPNGDRYREIRLKSHPSSENEISVAVGVDGLIHILDTSAERVFTYTPRFRMVRNWQPAANGSNARVRATAMAMGPDGNLYMVDRAGNRIVRFTDDGHFIDEVDASMGGPARRLSDEFAVARGYIFAMDADGRMLHVWSVDGKSKLDFDLEPELGHANRSAPALAVSPRKELLVLDAPEARVLRYRLNF